MLAPEVFIRKQQCKSLIQKTTKNRHASGMPGTVILGKLNEGAGIDVKNGDIFQRKQLELDKNTLNVLLVGDSINANLKFDFSWKCIINDNRAGE